MKKTIAIGLMLAIVLAGCSEDDFTTVCARYDYSTKNYKLPSFSSVDNLDYHVFQVRNGAIERIHESCYKDTECVQINSTTARCLGKDE